MWQKKQEENIYCEPHTSIIDTVMELIWFVSNKIRSKLNECDRRKYVVYVVFVPPHKSVKLTKIYCEKREEKKLEQNNAEIKKKHTHTDIG